MGLLVAYGVGFRTSLTITLSVLWNFWKHGLSNALQMK